LKNSDMNLYFNTQNNESKCNWVMRSLLKGWPETQPGDRQLPTLSLEAHFWGFIQNNWHLIKQHQENNVDWWFWDMPYWGRYLSVDENYWRISKNSVHETQITQRPCDRFERWGIDIKPWRRDGEEILVCPSSNTMTDWCSQLTEKHWTELTVNTIKKHTDRPVRVRHKPRTRKTSGPAAEAETGSPSFIQDIQNAYAVVTSVSLCAVEAIINGVPVVCNPLSFAAPVSETDISNINQLSYPERQPWLNHLAYQQYTEKEISSGLAYSIIGQ
jgi:hypothetical protein